MTINAIVADDEPVIVEHIRLRLLELWPELHICGEAYNGEDALQLIEKLQPNIAFLDIKMPLVNGLDVAMAIDKSNIGCLVVFITAYDDYAIEAFDKAAIDYLLKPVERERLEKTVVRLKSRIEETPAERPGYNYTLEDAVRDIRESQSSEGYRRWIRASDVHGDQVIPVNDIYYFRADNTYTVVVTRDEELLVRKPIKELESELDPECFWRIHRGIIVNANYIASTVRSFSGKYVVRLRDKEETLPVSRSNIHRFQRI